MDYTHRIAPLSDNIYRYLNFHQMAEYVATAEKEITAAT